MKRIRIIPAGEVSRIVLDAIARLLRKTYACETGTDAPMPMPERFYNTRRNQYHATKILKALEPIGHGAGEFILAVVDEDLYVPGLNFVFGEADVRVRVAVIGLARLRQEFYGLEPDRELFLLRAAKEAIHELGHTRGLGHCPDRKCVMHFSNSILDTDVKEPTFCASCRNLLEQEELKDYDSKVL